MKKLILTAVALLTAASVFAQTGYQRSYTRKDGTVVQGSYHTQSNGTNVDNYSTQGNINPYTGSSGSRAQDYSAPAIIMAAVPQYKLVRAADNIISIVMVTKPTYLSVAGSK